MLKQLSIYAENRKSTLKNITGILEAEQINILGSVTNDSAEYGIVRMVVSEPDKAAQALEKEGYLCKLTDVRRFRKAILMWIMFIYPLTGTPENQSSFSTQMISLK